MLVRVCLRIGKPRVFALSSVYGKEPILAYTNRLLGVGRVPRQRDKT